ncbi:MAG TPA: ABC transporter substrate-binding protein [Solirubrobacteraceae bacterium]|nr:ABC transporter substrate-binding protein [Solirubrobacteraceae bacterium]
MRRVAMLTAAIALVAAANAGAANRVRFPFPQEDGSLTPYTFRLGYPLVTLVYDTLTWRDARGVPQPWLARSIRRGPDGRTLTIRLRDGVRWHDGRPLTAADVAFTYRYVRRHPHPRFTPQVRNVASVRVRARGLDTVVMRLRRPSLGVLDQPLADVPILPRHLWADLPPGRDAPPGLPVGSGPFRLVEHERDRRYTFAANRSYFMGRPTVDRLEVPIVGRADRMAQGLREGRYDAITAGPGADSLRSPTVAVASGPSYVGTVLMLNLRAPPFDRPEARRALAQAIDVTRLTRAVTGAVPGSSVSPADRGYLSPDSRWAAAEPVRRADPDAARLTFAEQGVGAITVLAPTSNPIAREAGRQAVIELQGAGALARLRVVAPEHLAHAVGQDGSRPTFQAAIWPAPALASYDPAFLRPLFSSGGELNYPGYASRAFDRAMDRAADATTEGDRRTAFDAALRRLDADGPVLPLLYAPAEFAYRPGVFDGWVFVRGSGILDKRSFLPHTATARGRPVAAQRSPVDPVTEDRSLLPYVAGGLGLVALLAAAVLVTRRRRR